MEIKIQEFVQQLDWKLEQLKTEILKTQTEIEERNRLLADKQQQVEHVLKLLESEGVQIDRTKLDGIIPVSLSEIIMKVLKTHKKPMHYKDIAAAVLETGHKVTGQNPSATMIALLHRRKDDFVRYDEGVWGLKEWNLTVRAVMGQKRKKTRRVKRKRRS